MEPVFWNVQALRLRACKVKLDTKIREYLLAATGGKAFPDAKCPNFKDYCKEVLDGVSLWPVQKLILKTIINTIGLFDKLEYTDWEAKTLAQWQENAKRPTDETKYAQAVVRTTPKSKQPIVILLVCGRGGSKTFMSGLLISYFVRWLLSLKSPHWHFGLAKVKPIAIQALAGKESQAVSLFRVFKSMVAKCKDLKGTYDEFKESLNFGNVVEARAYTSNSNTVRGEDTFCYYHEETAFCAEDTPDSEKSFTQCYTAIRPAVKNRFGRRGIMLFVTSAGMKKGQTWTLYRQIKNGTIENCVMFQLAIWNINPNFQREDFAQEYREDPVTTDAEHGSQFVDAVNTFLTQREVWGPVKSDKKMLERGVSGVQYWIRLDPSRKHDRYALALGHKEYRRDDFGHERIVAVVDYVTYWQARWFDHDSGEEAFPRKSWERSKYRCVPVNPQEVLAHIEDLCERFNIVGVSSDQFESQYMVEELNDRFGSEEFPFGFIEPITQKSNWLAYRNLKKLINNDCFEIYPCQEYIEEATVAMRYNKNKPLDTKPDDLNAVQDEWEEEDEDASKIDDPNLIYTVEAPRSGAVRTDDILDAVTYLLWDMMSNMDMGVAELKYLDTSAKSGSKRTSAKLEESKPMMEHTLQDMPETL